MSVRAATPSDTPLILDLIRELASYENLEHALQTDETRLHEHLFGARPYAEALIAGDGAGFALYFFTYSTFLSRPGLYLEDLFVRPEHRRRGLGLALLRALARIAVDRGCGRLEWSVLDWNEPALAFYRSLGAEPVSGWTVHRLDGVPLRRLAEA